MKNLKKASLLLLVIAVFSVSVVAPAAARERHRQPVVKARVHHPGPVARHHQVRPPARKIYVRPYRRPLPPPRPRRHCHKAPRYIYPALVGAGVGLLAWGLSR